jgi:glutamate racemase
MIGIFDSGSGGLTVLRALRTELPSADVVYFGDIKNAPYGARSQKELSQLTVAAIRRLRERGAERIISACNSVSASLALSLLNASAIKAESVVEMVGPTVAYFAGVDTRIALCATEATVRSGMYENAFYMIGKEPTCIAIPELAGLIEFGGSRAEIKQAIETALAPHRATYDVLILACTHYPIVADVFKEVVDSKVILFDPAFAVAERAKKLFWPQEVGNGTTTFLLSQESAQFVHHVETLLPGLTYKLEVVE